MKIKLVLISLFTILFLGFISPAMLSSEEVSSCSFDNTAVSMGDLDLNIPLLGKHSDLLVEMSGFDVSPIKKNKSGEYYDVYYVSDKKKKVTLVSDRVQFEKSKSIKLVKSKTKFLKLYENNKDKDRALGEDIEDISTGPCFDGEPKKAGDHCLYVADIGGGKDKLRNFIRIFVVKNPEFKAAGGDARIQKIITARYPNQEEYDAEALAVHPVSGDIFIATKHLKKEKEFVRPVKIFKLSKSVWTDKTVRQPKTLDFVGEINLVDLNKKFLERLGVEPKAKDFMGGVVTGMDISKDGHKFIFATYRSLFEFQMNLSDAGDSEFVKIEELIEGYYLRNATDQYDTRLLQQEAVSYSPSGEILYGTEFIKGNEKIMPTSPLLKLQCLKK